MRRRSGSYGTLAGAVWPRLRRQGLVVTTWQESASGPPRRYYQITAAGRAAVGDFTQAWAQLRDSVDELLTAEEAP